MNLIIPMAGEGQRFKDAGYTLPKPLIDVLGKPMIQRVIESLNLDAKYTFFAREEHEALYGISSILKSIVPDCKVILAGEKTSGAAESVAKSIIYPNDQLFIANSDQIVDFEFGEPLYEDGLLYTFRPNDGSPKWSYCIADKYGKVSEVVEKRVVSEIANTGLYWFKKGKYYQIAYELMLQKQLKTNGEYYVAPVYNELIRNGFHIGHQEVERMVGIGTPEDLDKYAKQLS